MCSSIISVDLAYKEYKDVGIVELVPSGKEISIHFISPNSIGLTGNPDAKRLADSLISLSQAVNSPYIFLDGPQAWKDPNNGLIHSRLCERELNTPGKTGLPGQTKPQNYRPFIEFSIAVFQHLMNKGAKLFEGEVDGATGEIYAIESFPTAAWGLLGLPRLPSKRRSTLICIEASAKRLAEQFSLNMSKRPSHDELQAIVAGLAGLAFLSVNECINYRLYGCNPRLVDGIMREGFIVCPARRK